MLVIEHGIEPSNQLLLQAANITDAITATVMLHPKAAATSERRHT